MCKCDYYHEIVNYVGSCDSYQLPPKINTAPTLFGQPAKERTNEQILLDLAEQVDSKAQKYIRNLKNIDGEDILRLICDYERFKEIMFSRAKKIAKQPYIIELLDQLYSEKNPDMMKIINFII